MKKRCDVLKAEKMQKREKEIQTHGTRFCAWYYQFCYCSHVLPGEKELDCFTRETSKGRFLLLFVLVYSRPAVSSVAKRTGYR